MAAQDSSQSYLSKLSPWSRSPTVQPSKGKNGEPEPLLKPQKGTDHVISQRHRLSLRQYPRDCPHLRPQWFHAVDSPKRRPTPAGKIEKDEKAPATPKKYAAFSTRDSKAIEVAYRKLAEEEGAAGRAPGSGEVSLQEADCRQRTDDKTNLSLDDNLKPGKLRVPVNEDYLFDVDVERRELGPAYWLGPVYDVRRGTWFYQDGIVQRPCDENLASQLEDGYLKLKAWRLRSQEPAQKSRSSSQPRGRPTSWTPGQDEEKLSVSVPMTPKGSSPDLRRQALADAKPDEQSSSDSEHPQNTYRLFGAHMNSVVTYQDATTAWLLTDDFMSRMNYSMYQRFAGGGHLGGMKLSRGYIRETKKADGKDDKSNEDKPTTIQDNNNQDETPTKHDPPAEDPPDHQTASEARRARLERHMSSLLEDPTSEDRAAQEEELRKRDEREMEEDYLAPEGDEQGREIEHLILVTHGIGQRLGLRIESVNFVHDVNTLRKTIKAVYADSPDLRALNAELGSAEQVNSRVQVLPICWRHLLDFPKQSLRHNRKEQDLADTEFEDEEEYPSLEDISVDGVPAVRNLITDLALDILLYQSAAYKDHISRIVLEECNRIYHLFMERNPNFRGKVSLIGHSLGSAIMFDLLCRQGLKPDSSKHHHRKDHNRLKFDFDVEDFYALGSPIGLFQMLKGRTVAARQTADKRNRAVSTSTDDPMFDVAASAPPGMKAAAAMTDTTPGDIPVSSPKCAQIFNIFHPTDPISYRMEPLISPAMSALKPQPLPYTKRGIFGAPMGQGLTGIGARVSQSVSSMWSSMASSLLTRGLGYTGGEPGQLANAQNASGKSSVPLSLGAGTNVGAGVVPTAPPLPADGTEIAKIGDSAQDQIANDTFSATQNGHHPPTLIDAELETLYGGFQKRRKSVQSDSEIRDLGAGPLGGTPEWQDAEERAKRLRREEEKVRRLNGNGRVDYAIQEGAFDINLIAAIASHLSYWSDEDVSHFVVSQLLSRHRVVRPRSGGEVANTV